MKKNDNGGVCAFNPPITDEEISFVLDGDLAYVRQSNPNRDFTQCTLCLSDKAASCRFRLSEAYQFEEQLKNKLFRFDCPDTTLIGNFARTQLSELDLERVKNHLDVCTLCRTEVAHLRRFYAKPEPAPEEPARRGMPLRSPFIWIANLINPQEEALDVRGGDNPRGDAPRRIFAEVNEVTIFVEISKGSDDDFYTVEGQVLTDIEAWESALVELSGDAFAPRLIVVDEVAEFKFENVQGNTVLLKVTGQEGIAILLPEIDLHAEEDIS